MRQLQYTEEEEGFYKLHNDVYVACKILLRHHATRLAYLRLILTTVCLPI